MSPILGVIASAKSGRLTPVITTWISNVIYSGSGSISIVGAGNASISGPDLLIASGGGGAGISGGTKPSYWTQGPSGNYTQTRTFTSLATWGLSGAVTDASGNVYVTIENPGSGDGVVGKVSPAGVVLWAKNLNGYPYNRGLMLSPDGTALVLSVAAYEQDNWLRLSTADGSLVWGRTFASRSVQNGFASGMNNTHAYFGGYQRDGTNEGFVRQCNVSNGTNNWSKRVVYADYTVTTGVFTDTASNAYWGGYSGSANWFVKANSSGTLQWARFFGSGQWFPGRGAVDSLGNVYMWTSNGSQAYLLKYDANGTLQWQRSMSGSSGGSGGGNVVILNDSFMLVTFSASDGSFSSAYQAILPTDGSKTGTYTVGGKTVIYAASSITNGSIGASLADAGIYSSATYSTTNAGLGTVATLGNSTGLTNI